jgi:hypothetical protein
MADGRDSTPASSARSTYSWTEIFRCFHIALDPRKLFVAAAGILVMSFVWWLLSLAFFYKAPTREDLKYGNDAILKELGDKKKADGNNYNQDDAKKIGDERFAADFAQWRVLDSLAGPGGRLRTLPWYEARGKNPFLFVTELVGSPAVTIVSPGVSPQTRFYLLLILLSNVAIWAFCAGIITRIAAVQLANKGPISIRQAVRFVCNRYLGYIGAPMVPLIIIAVCIFGLILYGILGLIPFIGDLFVYGIGLPIINLGGAAMAVFLIGLVGYPLMYPTLSAEGDQSDTFDALSRSINYVASSPWHYIWYWIVAVFYGAAVTFFVLFFTSLTVYVGKWAVGLTASAVWSDRKPDYLFIYAPESFGWRELLTRDSPYAVRGDWVMYDREGKETKKPVEAVRHLYVYKPVDPDAYKQARDDFYAYNTWGAGIVCFWLTLMFLVMLGFSYSFFWCAATMIYFLMRKRVDEAELDEVFLEDEEPEPPLAPPKMAESGASTALPVIAPPAGVSPPAPATIPFSPPPPTEEPKRDDNPPPM